MQPPTLMMTLDFPSVELCTPYRPTHTLVALSWIRLSARRLPPGATGGRVKRFEKWASSFHYDWPSSAILTCAWAVAGNLHAS